MVEKKKRGRPKGSKNKKKSVLNKLSIKKIEDTVFKSFTRTDINSYRDIFWCPIKEHQTSKSVCIWKRVFQKDGLVDFDCRKCDISARFIQELYEICKEENKHGT